MSNAVKNMKVKKKKHIGQNLDQKFTLEDRISMRQRDCGWSTHTRYNKGGCTKIQQNWGLVDIIRVWERVRLEDANLPWEVVWQPTSIKFC